MIREAAWEAQDKRACDLIRTRCERPILSGVPLAAAHVRRDAAYAADAAYGAELRRVFGKDAGDARYDARGVSTPELRRLCDAKLAADAAKLAADAAMRGEL